jgi:hypothetical protein
MEACEGGGQPRICDLSSWLPDGADFLERRKHKTEPELGFVELVPRRRLELPRPCGHQHLKLACLPISPSGQFVDFAR